MGRSNDFYDTRPMRVDEPKTAMIGRWRLSEWIPQSDSDREGNGRRMIPGVKAPIRRAAHSEERRTPEETAGLRKQPMRVRQVQWPHQCGGLYLRGCGAVPIQIRL